MNRCSDERYNKLLSAYELGMLTDEEAQELELHLFDCEYCFEQVIQYDEAVHQLKNNEKIRDLIQQINLDDKAAALAVQPAERERHSRKYWTLAIPVAAAVLIMVIFKLSNIIPFRSDTFITDENRLAITCFNYSATDNGEANWGNIISNLLISDLAASRYVQPIPYQQFSDVIRNMGNEDVCLIDQKTGLKAAKMLNARWMLTGDILQESPVFVISTRVIDVINNRAVSAAKMSGNIGEDIFSLVDRVTVELKKQLSLPGLALEEPDQPVAEITTNSTQAYDFYLSGVDNFYRFYFVEARNDFEKVIELDSAFAMAYYYLSIITDPDLILKAERYSKNLPKIEKLYILSRSAYISGDEVNAIKLLNDVIKQYPDDKMAYALMGQISDNEREFSDAIKYYSKAIEIDLLYKPAYNSLAYAYAKLKNYERAIWAINKYIELAPREANPYDTRGDIYFEFGYPEMAIESYQMALKIKPDFIESLRKIGLMYAYNGEYEKADSCFRELTPDNNPITFPMGLRMQADLLLRQGKFNKALEKLDAFLSFDQNPETEILSSHLSKSLIYLEMKELGKAIEEFSPAAELSDKLFATFKGVGFRHILVHLLLENGDFEKVEEITQRIRLFAEEVEKGKPICKYVQGCTELYRDNPNRAVTYFSEAAQYKTDPNEDGYFEFHFMLARAYHEAGQFDRAIEKYRELSSTPIFCRHFWTIWDVKINYYLGLANEKVNQMDKAIKHYQIFIDHWGNSDIDIEEIKKAKERLQLFQNKS